MGEEDRYNVIKGGKQLGPFTLAELLTAKLEPSDMVQLPNGNWVPASQSPAAGRVSTGAIGAIAATLVLVAAGVLAVPIVGVVGFVALAAYAFATRRPVAGAIYLLGLLMVAGVIAVRLTAPQ